jgi:organic radical activating enzyme
MTIQLSKEIGSNFCYAPWTNIHINPQGAYKTCCGGMIELADLRQNPIQEVVNSNQLIEIKTAILNNQVHKNCENCIRQEEMSSISERGWYDDISQCATITIDKIEDQALQNLDIRWSNTCNLSCTYCGHDASSQWASLKKIPVERLDYSNTMQNILSLIEQNRSSLKNLGLLGGEPLLQKENDVLLDVIDDDVHINLITNLSVPLENNRIFKKLLSKNRVVWDVSFDTIESKFEYVRHGANWENQLKNIRLLQEAIKDKPGHIIGVAGVYSIYNALNLSDIHQYFRDNNLPNIRWNELNHPKILSVVNLPKRFRLRAADELEKSIPYHSWHRQQKFLAEMANNIRTIENNITDCADLYTWHHKQESNYWPNFKYKFAELWPEYNE